jgi:two-component system NtrC family sensor kinase
MPRRPKQAKSRKAPTAADSQPELLSGLGEAILDALPVGIYAVDRALRVVAWNVKREEGPIGQKRGKVLGRPLRAVLTEGGFLATEPIVRKVFETGEPYEQMSETPGSRLFNIARLPVRRGGSVTHVLARFDDVTEQRALEMRVIANDRLAFLGQLVAGVAHEIANPLSGIAGCAEALYELASASKKPAARREAKKFRELIKGEVARCERLVRTLMESSRPGRSETSDLKAEADIVTRLVERHPAFARVKIVTRIPDRLVAQVDPDSLRQVLIALATNAARAMGGSGTLTLQGGKSHGRVVLDVIDTGPGVPQAVRPRLFEPYFTTDPASGAGLGLPIARSLVRSRGGELILRPTQKGAAFRVVLRPGRRSGGGEP